MKLYSTRKENEVTLYEGNMDAARGPDTWKINSDSGNEILSFLSLVDLTFHRDT